ncbi:hypothetical protein WT08_03895 [Burkholderia sp. MSMB1552]|nr:hypothetical protein WT08_03895 [Burkholderia sp. MSMB1552]KWZ51008.1 hypothetical protein WS92_27200 [Burkholderia sp. MSMB1588]
MEVDLGADGSIRATVATTCPMRSSRHAASGRKPHCPAPRSPVSTAFDSGGRSYGDAVPRRSARSGRAIRLAQRLRRAAAARAPE